MKLGMTGSRMGMTDNAKLRLKYFLNENNISEAHHGDCIGADNEFHDIITEYNIQSVIHPPTNNKARAFCSGTIILPEKDYIPRNHDIVDSTDLLIAFPSSTTEEQRSGTWATIRYARKIGKQVFIIYP
jgi:hypothetical protein